MLANHSGIRTGYLAGKYPGKIGHLYSPGAQRGPYPFIPYATDNGAFKNRTRWIPEPWLMLLQWAKISGQPPLWVLVPDVVSDRDGTLARWKTYAPEAKRYGWPLAFAVQDGMETSDVPSDADVIFVGGSTEWKWRTLPMWGRTFPRVHVGRVNTYRRLVESEAVGAESVDGTGWMRGDQLQFRGLCAYLDESFGFKIRHKQEVMFQ